MVQRRCSGCKKVMRNSSRGNIISICSECRKLPAKEFDKLNYRLNYGPKEGGK